MTTKGSPHKVRYGRLFNDKALIESQLNGTNLYDGIKYGGKPSTSMRPKITKSGQTSYAKSGR